MTAKIYLEGGGDSKDLHILCRQGFRQLMESAGFSGRMPRFVSCGGRDAVYDDFKTAHEQSNADYVAMLIDSEDPFDDQERTWDHLRRRDNREQPDGSDDRQVLFMATCMETWIVSDRDTLRQHYGHNLQESALPPLDNLEQRSRQEVQESLKRATRRCQNAYRKGKRSFEVLGKLDPATLETHLAAFRRTKRILNEKLQ
jgi:hypothetical protein